MSHKSLLAIAVAMPLMLSYASAQTAQTNGVDPACMMKNSDGTQKVDTTKCPDGKTMGSNAAAGGAKSTMDATKPANGNDASKSTAATGNSTTDKSTAATGNSTTDTTTTASTTQAPGDILVAPDQMTGGKIMSANDFIGKTIYSRNNETVGKVDDVILSENGVQAVVIGVGGFLGMGAKDVAVKLASIEMSKDGNNTKLMIDASKDQLKAAPTYDIKARTYTQQQQ